MFSRIFRPPAPVARRISASYRSYASKKGPAPFGVAFDIDGVLLRGKIPVLGAVEALKLLNAHSVPYVFMTNGGGTLEKHKAESVAHALGVPVAVEQVILSHTPMKALAPKYKDQLVLLSGRKHVRDIAASYGFTKFLSVAELHALHPNIYPDFPSEISHPSRRLNKEDKIAAVMVFMDPLNWERDMQILCDVLRSDGSLYHVHDVSSPQTVALYMSCPDLLYSTDAPTPRFGSGAFNIALRSLFQELTGKPLQFSMYGKPFPETYRYAENLLTAMNGGIPLHKVYGIGDNPETDIAGANNAGGHWSSVLVKTGICRLPGNDPKHPADIVEDSVLPAIQRILAAELPEATLKL